MGENTLLESKQYTKRLVVPEAEELIGIPVKCLDYGHVILVDYMGGDKAIVDAARVSYQSGTKAVSDDRNLIRFLMRHRHTTPFEMVELKFRTKMPIFVARQWIRHRTANVNEESARYSILKEEFYMPLLEDVAEQSKTNRQGRGDIVDPGQAQRFIDILLEDSIRQYDHYQSALNEDFEDTNDGRKYTGKPKDSTKPMISRELARIGLTLNTYTSWYWKIDLHNLYHFLGLRMDSRAQKEIRVYADTIAEIAKKVAPYSYEAFEDYVLNAVTFSSLEIKFMENHGMLEAYTIIKNKLNSQLKGGVDLEGVSFSRRELAEYKDKLEKILSK